MQSSASAPDTQRRRVVVHVGPSRDARGGIASVLQTYAASVRLNEAYDVRFIATSRGGSKLAAMFRCLAALRELRTLTRSPLRPIVHVHMASGGSFWRKSIVLAHAARAGCPTVLHLHGGGFRRFADRSGRLVRRRIRRTFARATCVVVLSREWVENVAAVTGRVDAVVVPNPVIVPEECASGSEPPMVLFLGRLSERKGTDTLLDAAAILQSRGVRATYVLAGDGDVAEWRERVALLPHPEEVELPGWVGGDAKYDLLSSADVFCLPSLYEGVPMSILEALAWGVPCIATPVGGVSSVVADGVNGALVPPGDAPALADALMRLLTNPAERRRLGSVGREGIARTHGIDAVADALDALYRGMRTRGGVPR